MRLRPRPEIIAHAMAKLIYSAITSLDGYIAAVHAEA
jgi:hypothetical protein